MGEQKRDRASQWKEFASQADEIGFELRPEPFAVGDHDDIGAVWAASVPLVEYALAGDLPGVGGDDETEIERIVTGWENLDADNFTEDYQDFANASFVVIGEAGLYGTDGVLQGASAYVQELQNSKVNSPRQATLGNMAIVHIGGHRAAVTYTIDENLKDGTTFHGNAAAILAQLAAGWRIVIATSHLHG